MRVLVVQFAVIATVAMLAAINAHWLALVPSEPVRPFVFALLVALGLCGLGAAVAALLEWMPRVTSTTVVATLGLALLGAVLIAFVPAFAPGLIDVIPQSLRLRDPRGLVIVLAALGFYNSSVER